MEVRFGRRSLACLNKSSKQQDLSKFYPTSKNSCHNSTRNAVMKDSANCWHAEGSVPKPPSQMLVLYQTTMVFCVGCQSDGVLCSHYSPLTQSCTAPFCDAAPSCGIRRETLVSCSIRLVTLPIISMSVNSPSGSIISSIGVHMINSCFPAYKKKSIPMSAGTNNF